MEDVNIKIEIIENSEDEEPKLENDERYIPIEIVIGKRKEYYKEFNIANHTKGTMEEEEEEEENATAGVPLDVPSNRTSLIITHEDGTVEENEGEVTCLGLTPDLERRSKISIEEVIIF